MPKILVNYKMNKNKTYTILEGVVFADMPVAMAEYMVDYDEPVVVNVTQGGVPEIMEKSVFEQKLKELEPKEHERVFYLDIDATGKIHEVSEDKAKLRRNLPKDTDVSKLYWMDNQIVMLNDEEGDK